MTTEEMSEKMKRVSQLLAQRRATEDQLSVFQGTDDEDAMMAQYLQRKLQLIQAELEALQAQQ
jgi:hypothetical protein